jgi:hypothetical protein
VGSDQEEFPISKLIFFCPVSLGSEALKDPTMLLLSIPVLAFIALVLLALYKFIIYPAFISPLSKVPNAHWTAPFSPAWIIWTRFRARENRTVHAAHLRLGPVIRLAPNELSVNDVAGLKTVYAGGFEKGEWYSIFDNYGYAPTTMISL